MCEYAIKTENLGKMYKLFRRPLEKVLHELGFYNIMFWRRKQYREFWALRNINIIIRKKERIGIIGRNGAGKSTLLKIISGNIVPSEGSIYVDGQVQALMELGTGFHPEFTGRENVRASLAYQGLGEKDIRNLEEEIIDFAEIDEFIDQPIKTYSAGMYARLAFSVSTAIKPKTLIIDEILGAGDAYFTGKCIERMKKLTIESGATILFVSHDMASVQALCDRVIWIDRGQIYHDGDPLEVIKEYTAMVRKDEETRLKAREMKISRKQAAFIDKEKDIYRTLLFRFITTDGSPIKGMHKIRLLRLLRDSEEIGVIELGAPMDNDLEKLHHIIDEPGFTNWGTSSKDDKGFYRAYGDFNGKYIHAPFEFSIPKKYDKNKDLFLEVKYQSKDCAIVLDIYDWEKNSYENLGTLPPGDASNSLKFSLSPHLESFSPHEESQPPEVPIQEDAETQEQAHGEEKAELVAPCRDIRFSQKCKIISYDILGMDKRSTRIFPFHSQIKNIVFDLVLYDKFSYIYSSLLIFSNMGTLIVSEMNKIDLFEINGVVKVKYDFQKVSFGPGEYLISLGLYDSLDVLDNSREQPCLAILDRAISFRIEPPTGYNLNIGALIPEIPLSIIREDKEQICHSCIRDLMKIK